MVIPGRPDKYHNPRLRTLYLESQIIEALRSIARREGKSMNELINEILRSYVERHKEGNSTYPLDSWSKKPDFIAQPVRGELTLEYLETLPTNKIREIRALSMKDYEMADQVIWKRQQSNSGVKR
jgi:hypothetical protein